MDHTREVVDNGDRLSLVLAFKSLQKVQVGKNALNFMYMAILCMSSLSTSVIFSHRKRK